MMNDLKEQIYKLCSQFSQNGILWGMPVEDVVERLVSGADVNLWKGDAEVYTKDVLQYLELDLSSEYCCGNISRDVYDQLGEDIELGFEDKLEKIFLDSSLAQRELVKTDLRNKTEITLSDGSSIPINQH